MQCVILAGGLATRMKHLTSHIPKAMIVAGGQPFVHWQLKLLREQNVTDVVFCIGYRGSQIRDYVGDGSVWGMRVSYVDEGTQLMGTGGALRLAFDQGVLQERFFVLYGDSYLPVEYLPVWNAHETASSAVLMTVFRNEGRFDTSNVAWDGQNILSYDKKRRNASLQYTHIDYGLMSIRREFIKNNIEPGKIVDLADPLQVLSEAKQLHGYEVFDRFYEVGTPEGLADFEHYLKNKE